MSEGRWQSANEIVDRAREQEIAELERRPEAVPAPQPVPRGPSPAERAASRAPKGRPFPCGVCDFRATTRDGLEAHVARRHGPNAERAVLRPKGPQPLACDELDCSHVSESGQGAASHARMHARIKARFSGETSGKELPTIVELPSGVLLQGTEELPRPEGLPLEANGREVNVIVDRGFEWLEHGLPDAEPRLVRLLWRDAYSERDRQKPPHGLEVETIGWELEGDEDWYEIANERCLAPEGIEWRGLTYMLRTAIVTVEPV